MPKWIRFDLGFTPDATRKTSIWFVRTLNDQEIGQVKWCGRWRRYAFYTMKLDTVFEQDCLRDIADFCEQQTRDHRAAKKAGAA